MAVGYDFDGWIRRWLAEHPEPGTVTVEVLGKDVQVRPDVLCQQVPQEACTRFGDTTCGACPAYRAWRRTVRLPYEGPRR
jgi:hypothetical protein